MAAEPTRAVILVGHGGLPKDCPRELVRELRALAADRAARGGPPSAAEQALDRRIRAWPRTAATDPYQAGLEGLAAALRRRLGGTRLVVAYNEFCAPSLEDAVAALLADGVEEITVVPSMLTPGGSHSEIDIPDSLDRLRARHPALRLRYAWPVEVALLADMLATHLARPPG
ncbi:CbiX/SirB N-terminal domain-containing protein [bacterium]|nr:CbiX/SirB N-terminal domain-containing protein [bacterium]